jgi:hypothetical protein
MTASRLAGEDRAKSELYANGLSPLALSRTKLRRNGSNRTHVILNEVKNLIETTIYKSEILRLRSQNDIATQAPTGKRTLVL